MHEFGVCGSFEQKNFALFMQNSINDLHHLFGKL